MCLERQNNPAATYHLQERVVLEMVMFTVDFFVCLFVSGKRKFVKYFTV